MVSLERLREIRGLFDDYAAKFAAYRAFPESGDQVGTDEWFAWRRRHREAEQEWRDAYNRFDDVINEITGEDGVKVLDVWIALAERVRGLEAENGALRRTLKVPRPDGQAYYLMETASPEDAIARLRRVAGPAAPFDCAVIGRADARSLLGVLDAALARVGVLEDALRPFAAGVFGESVDDDEPAGVVTDFGVAFGLRAGAFRRADAVLRAGVGEAVAAPGWERPKTPAEVPT